ncbi:MAG: hypothetical protein H6608_11955 [Flavobacteriales bacterium]|nr:hypothetical protein [Bacteroidota bacterium]MCB9241843.1 hypothetical protein [Flavobacteriales bacterium]
MEHLQPHIHLVEESERLILTVDHANVFDYIEDYLTEECDLEYIQYNNPTATEHRLIFDNRYTFEEIQKALLVLDRREIERVFRQ